jgi:hypothetical protein
MRLLDRQRKLIHYLTSGAAIFDGEEDGDLDPALRGIDRTMLRLEAAFSHRKRMDKIAAVFPRTFARMRAGRGAILREFARSCPAVEIGRVANARQFYEFAFRGRRGNQRKPRYLNDIAACELAWAEARGDGEDPVAGASKGRRAAARGSLRRRPGTRLLRLRFDVRPAFERHAGGRIVQRDTRLAITIPRDGGEPQIIELAPVVFDLLAGLDEWTDPAALGAAGALGPLIGELTANGLLEAAR